MKICAICSVYLVEEALHPLSACTWARPAEPHLLHPYHALLCSTGEEEALGQVPAPWPLDKDLAAGHRPRPGLPFLVLCPWPDSVTRRHAGTRGPPRRFSIFVFFFPQSQKWNLAEVNKNYVHPLWFIGQKRKKAEEKKTFLSLSLSFA